MFYQRLNQCLFLCACVLFVGCGADDGPKLVPAGGAVKYKGKPIGKINVMLTPKDGKGMIAEGTSDASGNFKLGTKEPGDGAIVGDYTVTFKFVEEVQEAMPGMDGYKKPVSPIPEKYADTSKSGKTATVDADKSKNNFAFDLE